MAGGPCCGPLLTALLAAWLMAAAATEGQEQAALPAEQSRVQPMTASNWTLVMEGEWMLKFYAPWCPSCQQTDSEWETFAKNGETLQISVGKIDVIQEPGLSGRFFVTTLPAFFHAKDGIFRRYRGPGIFEDLQNYILEKKWQSVEPLTGWKSPASLTMSGMAGLFSISGKIWHLHNYFTVTLGIPAWCSYVFFVIATLVFGLFMGLILVIISECFCVPLPRNLSEHSEQDQRSKETHGTEQLQEAEEEKDDSNEEENKDSLVDDEEEKEDFGDEDEAEEEEEEDSPVGACQTLGTGMMLSSWATSSIEEVAEAGPEALRWLQLYIYKDREVTKQLVKRAEHMGYKAIFVTADTPYLGNRFDDVRNRFKLPPQLRMKNFETNDLAFSPKENFGDNSGLAAYVAKAIDPSLSWEDVKWLRRLTSLPIVMKGILRGDDAREAVKHGVNGILVSNHGARQLDGVPATIDVLPEIVEAVEGKVEVFLDGGVRKGTDVLKALALGARAVFVGRPIIWGLAFQGEKGVQDVLEILKEEFRLAMALSGCQNVRVIDKTLVRKNPLAVSKI